MPLTPEQFNRCACECMASLVNPYDTAADLKQKAAVAVEAASALSKAMSESKQRVGPMAPQKRIGRK